MKKYETPAEPGATPKTYTSSIPNEPAPVKSASNENLLILHTAIASLPPEDYKSAMTAVCQYLADGVAPKSEGHLGVIITLAIALIDSRANAPRRRGGQPGNRNAAKTPPENENEPEKSNRNESKSNRNESKRSAPIPARAPLPAGIAATHAAVPDGIAVPPPAPNTAAVSPPNLNLNNNININNNLINYLNCENESETEKRNRIKHNLKRFGFAIADKTVNKIIASVPNVIWLVDGYDFPSYLAQYVIDAYKGKHKTTLELQKLFLSAFNREKWDTPWSAYPNWLSERMEQVLVDKEILSRKTPPQNHCPDCGAEAKLDGLRCPKCGGFYEWDEATHAHKYVHHINLDFNGGFERLLAIKHRREQEAVNAGTV